jgi:hypothetical protein
MTPRMTNPAQLLPEALEAALALSASTAKGDLPPYMVELVLLRASQGHGVLQRGRARRPGAGRVRDPPQ